MIIALILENACSANGLQMAQFLEASPEIRNRGRVTEFTIQNGHSADF